MCIKCYKTHNDLIWSYSNVIWVWWASRWNTLLVVFHVSRVTPGRGSSLRLHLSSGLQPPAGWWSTGWWCWGWRLGLRSLAWCSSPPPLSPSRCFSLCFSTLCQKRSLSPFPSTSIPHLSSPSLSAQIPPSRSPSGSIHQRCNLISCLCSLHPWLAESVVRVYSQATVGYWVPCLQIWSFPLPPQSCSHPVLLCPHQLPIEAFGAPLLAQESPGPLSLGIKIEILGMKDSEKLPTVCRSNFVRGLHFVKGHLLKPM